MLWKTYCQGELSFAGKSFVILKDKLHESREIFGKSKEKPINKDGNGTTRQKDVRKANLLINGKESRCRHENPWNIYKGGSSKIIKDQYEHSNK